MKYLFPGFISRKFVSVQVTQLNDGVRIGGADGAFVKRTVLPCGVRVLTESMRTMRSATIGFWVPVGSRHERDTGFGSTHFLEHLMFKGTRKRSAFDISYAFDSVGGMSNAGTGKEYTYYYAQVRDADVPMAIDVLGDMLTSATLLDEHVEAERGVILDELAMDDDDADDVASEKFLGAVYGEDEPMGRPIGGTPETVSAITGDAIRSHYSAFYYPHNLVVSLAGNVDHDAVCEQIETLMCEAGWGQRPVVEPTQLSSPEVTLGKMRALETNTVVTRRPTEQAHLVFGGPGLHVRDERVPVQTLFSGLLGGDSSSRLTQEIREKRGLTYSVYSSGRLSSDCGHFQISAGCAPKNAQLVVDLALEQWRAVAQDGPTEAERQRVVGGMAGYMALGLERTGARMHRLAWAELFDREFMDAEAEIARMQAVTCGQIQELAAELYDQCRHVSIVSPLEDGVKLSL